MSKIYKQPVAMQLGSAGQPFSFSWRGQWHLIERYYPVEVPFKEHQFYKRMGLGPYDDRYRCSTDTGITCDLVQYRGTWTLERIWD